MAFAMPSISSRYATWRWWQVERCCRTQFVAMAIHWMGHFHPLQRVYGTASLAKGSHRTGATKVTPSVWLFSWFINMLLPTYPSSPFGSCLFHLAPSSGRTVRVSDDTAEGHGVVMVPGYTVG